MNGVGDNPYAYGLYEKLNKVAPQDFFNPPIMASITKKTSNKVAQVASEVSLHSSNPKDSSVPAQLIAPSGRKTDEELWADMSVG